ncbi:MAG: M23 family metallopeptidase [Hyphomicrobiales bacterium]|nr:M23 family metallopeptidase [Hyphomicrobiales bacterium]MBV8444083.1 M23 family metallopeptidase [Hyphomicrobiales bacterium]
MSSRSITKRALAAWLLIGFASGPAFSQDASTGAAVARDKFRWPIRGPILQRFKAGENDGIDILAAVGEWVHAAADGVCIYAGDDIKTYGKLVLIRHADGYVTAYADNSELEVKEGDAIKRGQTIAKAGASGEVKSPRLHFELRKDGQPVDPVKYLVPL